MHSVINITVFLLFVLINMPFFYDDVGDIDDGDGYEFPIQVVGSDDQQPVYDMDTEYEVMRDYEMDTEYEVEKTENRNSFSETVNKWHTHSIQENSEEIIYDFD